MASGVSVDSVATLRTLRGQTTTSTGRSEQPSTGADAANRLAQNRKRLYGISVEDFTTLLRQQGGGCAICSEIPEREFHVDHDHATGVVRGLLCGSCNLALGHLKDDPVRLRAAVQYLEAG